MPSRFVPFRAALALVLLWSLGCEERDGSEIVADEIAEAVDELGPVALAALPEGMTAEAAEQGRQAYVVCSVCHGLDARGTPLGPSLRDTSWIHIGGTPEEIADIVRRGVSNPSEFPIPMPVMGGGDFDDGELRALASYVYALGRG